VPALSAHYAFRAFRQMLEYAVAMGLLESNPSARIRNTRVPTGRRDMRPFESWEEVEAIAAEMDPRYAAIPIVLVGTGLRPEELWALERRDVDLDERASTRRNTFSPTFGARAGEVRGPSTDRAATGGGEVAGNRGYADERT
jgi:integrase